ncbi:MAG TPA: sialidase family protein [Mycobacteriales bacterium]|nr:sialidase family protein [Mycobacteriales bacterium]
MPRIPLRLAAALALTALPAAVPGGQPAAVAAGCARAAAVRAGRWFVAAPPLPAHSATRAAVFGDLRRIRAAGLDPADPRVVVVTDGERVQRSDDGGCTWREVWRLPETGPGSADAPSRDLAEIVSVDVAHAGRASRVLLAVAATGSGFSTGRTYLVRSADGRTGWTVVNDATLTSGAFDPMQGAWAPEVHSSGAAVAYAATTSAAGTVQYLRSADGGRTWALQTLPAPDAPTAIGGFAVSPFDANELWEWGGRLTKARQDTTRLRHSTDGGVTWTAVDPWPAFGGTAPSWTSLDVAWPRRGAPARLLVLGGVDDGSGAPPTPALSWSGDGGRTFRQVVPPFRTGVLDAAVAHTASGAALVLAHDGTAYRLAYRASGPRPGDWRALPRLAVRPGTEWTLLGHGVAHASATAPAAVAVLTATNVQLLTVAP